MKGQLAFRQDFDIEKFSTTYTEILNQLGSQQNLETLVETLEDILENHFSIQFSFFIAVRRDKGFIKPLENQVFTNTQIETQVLAEISRTLSHYPEDQIDGHGNQVLQVGESGFHFRFFTNGMEPVGAFFWLEGHGQTEFNLYLMDQVLTAAQQFACWCCRLQNSQELLYRDDLTNLYNYRYLDISLDNEIRRVQRFQTTFSLLFLSILIVSSL